MEKLLHKVGIATLVMVIAASIYFYVRWKQDVASKDEELRATVSKLQEIELEKAGWGTAKETLDIELSTLKDQLAKAKEVKTTPILRASIPTTTSSTTITTTCPKVSIGETVESTTVETPVDVTNSLQLALDATADATIVYTGTITTHLDSPSSSTSVVTELDPHSPEANVGVAPHLRHILNDYYNKPPRITIMPRSWRHVRAGWTVGIDPIRSVTDGKVAPAIVYGAQF